MTINKIKILNLLFEQAISHREISLFRGAIINLTDKNNVLFHNHMGEKFRYSYPLIQYKRIRGKASIICLGDGVEAIGEFFASGNFDVNIGNREERLELKSVRADQFLIQAWDDMFAYSISNWLPFNAENYVKFSQTESLAEKMSLLERTLTGNILSMAKGLGIYFERQVVVKITEISEPKALFYKEVKMMGFNACFKTNVSLPNNIGLGKGVSLGMGMVNKIESNKE